MGNVRSPFEELPRTNDEPIVVIDDPTKKTEKELYFLELYKDENLFVPATDGTRTIANSPDVFTGYIDPNFSNSGLNLPVNNTLVTSLAVLQIMKDGKHLELFNVFGCELHQLWWQESQVVEFCDMHPEKFCKGGCDTFFLLKGGELVAGIRSDTGDCLCADAELFLGEIIWHAQNKHRLVIPKKFF